MVERTVKVPLVRYRTPQGVRSAARGQTIKVAQDEADRLDQLGHLVVDDAPTEPGEELAKMKVADLRKLAAELDVDVEGLSKPDIVRALVDAGETGE